MNYFPPKIAKARWGSARHNQGRLGSCKVDGQSWWLWSQMTSRGYWTSCWQCANGFPYATCNYKKSKIFKTEDEAIVWVENEVGLQEDQSDVLNTMG